MLDPQLLATLQRLPLFDGLPPQQLERIARIARVNRLDPGAVVFRQWDVARGFYMLLTGSGQLIQQGTDGGQRLLSNVLPNQYFNDAALTAEMVEQATFVITSPSLLLHIARADYVKLPPATLQPAALPEQRTAPGATSPSQGMRQPVSTPQSMPSNVQPPVARGPSPAASAQRQAAGAQAYTSGQPALSSRPKWLNPGESILLQSRRHWWVVIRNLVFPALLFVAFMVGVFVAQTPFLRLIVGAVGVLISGGWAIYSFFDWRNDWLVITDERVLRVEQQVARFSIQTQEVGLLSVQAVSATLRPGDPMARIFRYGDVVISTAGSAGNINMDFVPNPGRVKDYVFRQREIKMRASGYAASGNQPVTPGAQAADVPEDPEAFPRENDPSHSSPPVSGGGLFAMRYLNSHGEMVYRRHLVVWARKIFFPLLAMGICVLVLMFGSNIAALANLGAVANIGAFVGIGLSLVWLYLADWDWRNDLYIIGDTVLTLLYRSPLLLQFREDQVLIQRIHNIEAETTGLLRSLLDYGDVRVLLLGDEAPKVFRDVPSPVAVREEISRRQRLAADAARRSEEQRQLDAVMARMQAQGLVQPGSAALPNPSGLLPPAQPGQTPPASPYSAPVQPQRPPIPRRRV